MALGWGYGAVGLWGWVLCEFSYHKIRRIPFPTAVRCLLANCHVPTKTFCKNPAFQTDFQNSCNFQLSGQLEEREMARARASYVFPLFKAGVGEETPAEIGILRMIWILSMKLGPDMMKITLWILKYHFCGSNDMAKNASKISTKSVHPTSQILERVLLSSATAWEHAQITQRLFWMERIWITENSWDG